MTARATRLIVAVSVALAGSACGSADDVDAVPAPGELAERLLAPGDLDGGWSVAVFPDGDVDTSGVVTDAMQELLPEFALCPEAGEDARAATRELEWDAFMQLELATDDPIDPPDDRTGRMIFLQQYLAAADPADTRAMFDALGEGATACLGDVAPGDEGPGSVEPMDVPDLGDDRFGVLMTVEEAGGWAEWRLHQVVVREGPVLVILVVTDIRAGDDVEPYFTVDDIGDIARTAVAKL